MHQEEDQHRDDQRYRNGQDHEHRRLQVAHEEENDDAGQQGSRDDVVHQVADRIVEQFGLVARDRELHVRIVPADLAQLFVKLLLEFRHPGVGLFHDGQRHGVAAVREDHPLPFAGVFDDPGELLQTEQPSVDFQEDVLDVAPAAHHRAEFDAVLVFPVPDGQAAQRHVGLFEGALDGAHRNPRLPQFRFVGDDQQFGGHRAAQVRHRHFGQLLDALGDHLRGEAAQGRKVVRHRVQFVPGTGGPFAAHGQVDVEGRDVRGAGLDHLRTFQVARQGGDRAVDLFVDLDEQVVDVRTLLEGQADDAAAFPGFAAEVRELRQLDQLLAQRRDDRFVQLPRRESLRRNLDGDIWRVDVRNERNRQQTAADDAQDDQDHGDHRHGNGPVE